MKEQINVVQYARTLCQKTTQVNNFMIMNINEKETIEN